MENEHPSGSAEAKDNPPKKRRSLIILLLMVVCLLVLFTQIGFYTIQPIGAIPDGVTAVVWRASGEPFFNSADALCLAIQGGVSLLCRGMAMNEAPIDRIIVRLPYMESAYLLSTGGRQFDR